MSQLPVLDEHADSGWRRAALTLHALHGQDREWLLAQLGESARQRLQALLEELRELAWPADRQLVQAALALPARATPLGDVAGLVRLLQQEPDGLRRQALQALDAGSCAAVLAAWPEGLSRPRLDPSETLPPALAQALREALARAQQPERVA